MRERGGRAPGEQRRVSAIERRVLAPGLEHVVEPCADVSGRRSACARGSRGTPTRDGCRRATASSCWAAVRATSISPSSRAASMMCADRVRNAGGEAVLLARLEPVRRVGQRLVETARVQLDERAERRDERVARDRAARLSVNPRLVPDRLSVGEPVGERVGVDGEDVGGVVLGVERPGGESLLGAPRSPAHTGRASWRRRTRGSR